MKKIIIILMSVFIFIDFPIVHADTNDDRNVLIIYTGGEEGSAQERMLDSLVGHFTNNIDIIMDEDWDKINVEEYTHILYLGNTEKQLSKTMLKDIEGFSGPVFLIGLNGEQFTNRLSFISLNGMTTIQSARIVSKDTELTFAEKRLAVNIEVSKMTDVLIDGKDESGKVHPLIVKQGNTYYFALESLFNPSGHFLGEALFDFFGQKPVDKHPMYLRLEDIHPNSDPDNLMEIAKYLQQKDIPYFIVLIPTYVDPNTHEEKHLKDYPKLVKVLRYMQDNGGSVILHGYRHQYRHRETGEGFEFWDVDNDRPIWQKSQEEPLTRSDFNSEKKYAEFVEKGMAYEEEYITNAIERGIEELVAHRLYPIAFEAPHYAMSETGYSLLADHFSTYIGQLQLTNHTWESQYAPLYSSRPSFIHGMELLPESLGYVEDGKPERLQEIKESAFRYAQFSDAYLSVFYHPYLGLESLKQLVKELEEIPDTEWLDLKNFDNQTTVKGIHISSQNGEIIVDKKFISSEYEQQLKLSKSLPIAVFSLAAIVLLSYIIWKKMKRK